MSVTDREEFRMLAAHLDEQMEAIADRQMWDYSLRSHDIIGQQLWRLSRRSGISHGAILRRYSDIIYNRGQRP